jgi:hypothetical protein
MLRLGERAMQSRDGLGELLAMGDVTLRNAADAFEDADVELVGIFEPTYCAPVIATPGAGSQRFGASSPWAAQKRETGRPLK